MALVQVGLALTLAVYSSFFFVYGVQIFSTSLDTTDCTGFLDFITCGFDIAGRIIQFIFLSCSGCNPPLDTTVQVILLLTVGLTWFMIFALSFRGGGPS